MRFCNHNFSEINNIINITNLHIKPNLRCFIVFESNRNAKSSTLKIEENNARFDKIICANQIEKEMAKCLSWK